MTNIKNWRRFVAIGAALLLAGTGVAFGQSQAGNLFGTTSDDTGAALPGVSVTVTGAGAPRVQVTDAQGQFRFLGLSPGSYQLQAQLDSFSTIDYPNVTVSVNRTTTLEISLSPAIEETITVTSESPLLDERKITTGTTISQTELEKIPTSRDPWAILSTVPGVKTDRINVGGNESGQQSNFTGPGSSGSDTVWAVDGVVITDMAAIGGSPTYYNFDAFEEMQVSTGGSDASLTSGGVTMNMVTKRGTNEWRGSGRFIQAKDSWQDSLDFDQSELGDGQTAFSQGNRLVSTEDWGAELGGPVVQDKLWVWANYGRQEIDLLTISDVSDFTDIETYGAKINAQLGTSNSLVAFYNRSDNIKLGRNAGPSNPQPTTWNQSGPTEILKLEDTHIFNSSFFVTGLVSSVDTGFQLTPQGGFPNGPNAVLDENFIWQNNFLHHETDRPQEQAKLDGSYFFNNGNLNHELKFGLGYRTTELNSLSAWPGDVLRLDYYTAFGYSYNIAQISRAASSSVDTTYTSLYVQDTLTAGNLTANIGLRYDEQTGDINAVTVQSVPGFEVNQATGQPLLPTASSVGRDQGFTWEDITPRLGLTYALGEDRDTLLRASFSQFAQQLGQGFTTILSTAQRSYAYFYYEDQNGDGDVTVDEIINLQGGPLFTSSFDPLLQSTDAQIDPSFDAPLTDELILGVEHALLPELVVGLNLTWRNISDITESDHLIIDNGIVRPDRATDYTQTGSRTVTLPDGSTNVVPIYGLVPGLSDNGNFITSNGDREQEYFGASLTVNKRLANRWMLRGNFTWSEFDWDIPAGAPNEPNAFLGGGQVDGDPVLEASGTGSGPKGGVYINSNWSYSFTGMYQVAPDRRWGFNVAASVNGREGYPVPYYTLESNPLNSSGSFALQATNANDDFRLDDVLTVDLRVEKEFTVNNFSFTVGAEVFNLFNEATVLQRQHRLRTGVTNFVTEILSPRIARIAFRVNLR